MVKHARASKLGSDGTETSVKQHGLQQLGAKHIGPRDVPVLIEVLIVAVIIVKLVGMLLPILSKAKAPNTITERLCLSLSTSLPEKEHKDDDEDNNAK